MHSLIIIPVICLSTVIIPMSAVAVPYTLMILMKYNRIIYGSIFSISGFEFLLYIVSIIVCGVTGLVSSNYLHLNYQGFTRKEKHVVEMEISQKIKCLNVF